jgi:hypothetical protein
VITEDDSAVAAPAPNHDSMDEDDACSCVPLPACRRAALWLDGVTLLSQRTCAQQ